MATPQYNDNLLIQYLLGGLSEAQVEEFDELSIVDDEFAAQLGEVENDLIDAYVQGTLSGPTRVQFEARYLTSPRRREKVKFAQSLQTFVETKAQTRATEPRVILADHASQEVQPTAPEPVESSVVKAVPWWRSLFTIPSLTLQWGLATAALLMLVIGGWLTVKTLHLQDQVEQAEAERAATQQREKDLQAQLDQTHATNAQTAEQLQVELKRTQEKLAQLEREQQLARQQAQAQPPTLPQELSIAQLDLSPNVRSGGTMASLPLSAGTDYVTLQIELEADNYPIYRAELRRQADDKKVWGSGKLKSRARGNSKGLDVSLRADLLQPRGYILKVVGITATSTAEDVRSYPFTVVKKQN